MSPPIINTYHCTFCSNLVLATTHVISTLPMRKGRAGQGNGDGNGNGDGDGSFILPVSRVVPRLVDVGDVMDGIRDGDGEGGDEKEDEPLPIYGYTALLSLAQPNKEIIIRREDGFEKRRLWRCGRCAVVVGYEVLGEGKGKGKGKDVEGDGEGDDGFEGMILYLLRGALMSTRVMRDGRDGRDGKDGKDGKEITERDVGVLGNAMGVWE